jgi:hypothetical protein
MIDRFKGASREADLDAFSRLASAALRAPALQPLLLSLGWLATRARAVGFGFDDDDYYFTIKNRCMGMNGVLLNNSLAQKCCAYPDGNPSHPDTKLGAPGCPGSLDDLIADVHERALPPPGGGGPGGGGGGGGDPVEAAAAAILGLSGKSAPAKGDGIGNGAGGYGTPFAQGLGAGGNDVSFSKSAGGTGSARGGTTVGGKGEFQAKRGSGYGSGGGAGGSGGGGLGGGLSTAPADDASKTAAATAGGVNDGASGGTYAAVRGGGGNVSAGLADTSVDKIEWNIPGQGADAGAKGEGVETDDPSNYFDRIRSDESIFKRVEARYKKKRPQFVLP